MLLSSQHHHVEKLYALFNEQDNGDDETLRSQVLIQVLQDQRINAVLFHKSLRVQIYSDHASGKKMTMMDVQMERSGIELDGLVFIDDQWHKGFDALQSVREQCLKEVGVAAVEVRQMASQDLSSETEQWCKNKAAQLKSHWDHHCLNEQTLSSKNLKSGSRL